VKTRRSLCAAVSLLVGVFGAVGLDLGAQQIRRHPSVESLRQHVDHSVSRTAPGSDGTLELAGLAKRLRAARLVRTVGVEEGSETETLGSISGAVLDSRNRLFVLDRSFTAVRAFQEGVSPSVIGRRGSGPLDLRYGVSIWPEGDGRFGVADGMLGVKVIDASSPAPRLVRVVSVGTDITGACRTPSAFVVYRSAGDAKHLIQRFDTLGRPLDQFGARYVADSRMVSAIMSEGVVGCGADGSVVYAMSGMPFVHGYRPDGRRAWTLRLSDFEVGDQQESVDARGRRSIGMAPDVRRFSLIRNIVGMNARVALVQVESHSPQSMRARKDYERLESYLVDIASGHAIFASDVLPMVSYVKGSTMVTFTNDPFPQIRVLELGP
jgi:hypothetical protein